MYRRLRCRGHEYSSDHHLDVDLKHVVFWLTTKFLSYARVDFLKMADVVRGYCLVVVRQACTNGILCRLSSRYPCAGAWMYI